MKIASNDDTLKNGDTFLLLFLFFFSTKLTQNLRPSLSFPYYPRHAYLTNQILCSHLAFSLQEEKKLSSSYHPTMYAALIQKFLIQWNAKLFM